MVSHFSGDKNASRIFEYYFKAQRENEYLLLNDNECVCPVCSARVVVSSKCSVELFYDRA
jgi:hypothetical protein